MMPSSWALAARHPRGCPASEPGHLVSSGRQVGGPRVPLAARWRRRRWWRGTAGRAEAVGPGGRRWMGRGGASGPHPRLGAACGSAGGQAGGCRLDESRRRGRRPRRTRRPARGGGCAGRAASLGGATPGLGHALAVERSAPGEPPG